MCRRCHKLHVTQRSDQYHKVHLIRRALHVSTKPLTSKGAAPNLFNQPERESFDGSGRRSDSAAAPASAAVKTSASIYISNARGARIKARAAFNELRSYALIPASLMWSQLLSREAMPTGSGDSQLEQLLTPIFIIQFS